MITGSWATDNKGKASKTQCTTAPHNELTAKLEHTPAKREVESKGGGRVRVTNQ